jgi:hypothetical protein
VFTVRLTILGCAGSIPGPGANASGYLLEADGFVMALELGNGTLSQLQAVASPFDLDALVLSHLHPAHCADFAALTVVRRYHPLRPDGGPGRLPVYGPRDVEQRLVNLYAPNEAERAETDLNDVYRFSELSASPVAIGPFQVTAYEVCHPTPAYGFRIRHGGKAKLRAQLIGSGAILREVLAAADLLRDDWGVESDVWSATSFTELRRDGMEADRWNLLNPGAKQPKRAYVAECLDDADGPVVAATDYMRAFADQIRPWVKNRYTVLGTDGFGRSDSRERLRHHFEVDRRWVAIAALKALADEGTLDAKVVKDAMKKYGLDAKKPVPWKN